MRTEGTFACPSCGRTDDFTEFYVMDAWAFIDHIDENGTVHYTGESDYGEQRGDFPVTYSCVCGHQFDAKAFDPKERIAEALAALDELTKEPS